MLGFVHSTAPPDLGLLLSGIGVLERASRTQSNVSSYRQLSPLILAEVVDLGSDNVGGSYQSPAALQPGMLMSVSGGVWGALAARERNY